MPTRCAMASAVRGASPVIITGLMPAARQRHTACGTSGAAGPACPAGPQSTARPRRRLLRPRRVRPRRAPAPRHRRRPHAARCGSRARCAARRLSPVAAHKTRSAERWPVPAGREGKIQVPAIFRLFAPCAATRRIAPTHRARFAPRPAASEATPHSETTGTGGLLSDSSIFKSFLAVPKGRPRARRAQKTAPEEAALLPLRAVLCRSLLHMAGLLHTAEKTPLPRPARCARHASPAAHAREARRSGRRKRPRNISRRARVGNPTPGGPAQGGLPGALSSHVGKRPPHRGAPIVV